MIVDTVWRMVRCLNFDDTDLYYDRETAECVVPPRDTDIKAWLEGGRYVKMPRMSPRSKHAARKGFVHYYADVARENGTLKEYEKTLRKYFDILEPPLGINYAHKDILSHFHCWINENRDIEQVYCQFVQSIGVFIIMNWCEDNDIPYDLSCAWKAPNENVWQNSWSVIP